MKKLVQFFVSALTGLLFSPFLCSSQDIHFTLVPRSQDDIGSVIIAVTQDSKGYLWFATQNGLYKYDGVQYTAYHNQPTNPNSLILENVECVEEDKQGFIWVGHYHSASGLERLDPATGIFTHYHHDEKNASSLGNDSITVVMHSRDGTLWIGTNGGLDRYDDKTNKFFHYRFNKNDSTSISSNQVRIVYEDKEGIIWVGCGNPFVSENPKHEGGLNQLDVKTGKFKRYLHKENDPNSLMDDRVRAIYEDSYGNFWVGSAGDGLHKMDRKNGTFQRLLYDPAHPKKLSRPPVQKTFEYATDHITFINEDINGLLWIGTFQGGINVYDPATQKVTYYGIEKNSKEIIQDKNFWTAYKARDGIMWLTTWGGDLYKINPFQVKVPYTQLGIPFYAFAEDNVNTLWMATNYGLLRKDSGGKVQRFLIDKDTGSVNNLINELVIDEENRIWTATNHGLYYFDPVKKSFTGFHAGEEGRISLLSDTIITIKKNKENQLWVGTYRGLELIDIKKGTLKVYKNDPKDSTSISSNIISFVNEDSKGTVWVGCFNGLNRLDKQTGRFKKFINQNRIFQVYEDKERNSWAATIKGLFRYDQSTDNFIQYTRESGILNGSQPIFWILEDQDKNFWLNTLRGIVKLNKEKDEEVLFGKNQGVNGASLGLEGFTRRNGDILFSEYSGFFTFNKKLLQQNSSLPIINITNFLLKDIPVQPTEHGTLSIPIEQTKEIYLVHDQNTFSFEFSNIDFISQHEDTRLLYKLENYDISWHMATDSRNAYYFNLPPGHYNFKVKAFSANGASAEKEISMIITPPWWKRWWAYCIYGLLTIVIAFFIHRFQKERLIKAERERARVKELAQAKEIEKAYHELRTTQSQLIQQEKMASLGELTAGIAHEIQNPLNFVNNFSEINRELIDELKEARQRGEGERDTKTEDEILSDINKNLEKISFHGERADAIVKNMLQHSKSGGATKEPTDINKLADEYLRLSYHGLRAKDKSFNADFKTALDNNVGKIDVIPQDVGRVLLNLFNNAFYATNEKSKQHVEGYEPKISVSTKKINGKVEIFIKDNGNGMPQKVVDKIFQPFFTTKPTGQGTGLGLSLSYDIIKAHNGEIKVQTKENEGSEFIIQLPIV